jgi:hypothetical protein
MTNVFLLFGVLFFTMHSVNAQKVLNNTIDLRLNQSARLDTDSSFQKK